MVQQRSIGPRPTPLQPGEHAEKAEKRREAAVPVVAGIRGRGAEGHPQK